MSNRTEIEAHETAVALIVAHKVQWCRARLMHALAAACEQGVVLEEVLAELLPSTDENGKPNGRGEWDGYETGDGIAGEIEHALRKGGWINAANDSTHKDDQ